MKFLYKYILVFMMISFSVLSITGCNKNVNTVNDENTVELPSVTESIMEEVEKQSDKDLQSSQNSTGNIVSSSSGVAAERIESDYRPDGYNFCIGDSLALKMSVSDENFKYRTIVFAAYNDDIKELVDKINKNSDDIHLNMDEWMPYEHPNFPGYPNYYYIFSAEEIYAMAEAGIRCRYVGSGEGSLEDANLDTPEGINVYCELLGGSYRMDADGTIQANPDIWIEN